MYSEICFHFHIDTRIETFSSRRQRILFSYFVHNFNFVALLSENVCFLFIHLEKTVVSLVVQDMIRVGVHEYWKNTFYIFMEENLIYIYIIISVFCIPIFFTSSNRRLEEVNYYCISIFLWLSYIFIY